MDTFLGEIWFGMVWSVGGDCLCGGSVLFYFVRGLSDEWMFSKKDMVVVIKTNIAGWYLLFFLDEEGYRPAWCRPI